MLYIEEARALVRQFEERGTVSRAGSVSADSMSGTSLSVVSEDMVSVGGQSEISEETALEWDKMDVEVKIPFECCFLYTIGLN